MSNRDDHGSVDKPEEVVERALRLKRLTAGVGEELAQHDRMR